MLSVSVHVSKSKMVDFSAFMYTVILLFESLIHGFNLFSPRQVASILNILDNELVQNVGNYIVRLVAVRSFFILDLSRNIFYIFFT